MLATISSSAIPSYPVVQKSPTPSLLSLPVEIREEIENHLTSSGRQALFEAQTTVTHNGGVVDSPALKLHLLRQRVPPKYQQILARSDTSLQAFALSQLKQLWELGRLDQVVERPAFFELLCLVNDPTIFVFLSEKIRQEPALKQTLVNWVERSKTEEVQTVAANALTILVKSGVQFNGADLKGIRIAGADLSGGIFDHAQLQGSDLTGVKLHKVWLRQANLSRAQMAGAQFGAWPLLKEDSYVSSCAYSPDGKAYAVGLMNGNISIYATSSWEKIQTLGGHSNRVNSVVYAPNGKQIASGSFDRTVRLWNVETGACHAILSGHIGRVLSVVYSPKGDQLASGSWEIGRASCRERVL